MERERQQGRRKKQPMRPLFLFSLLSPPPPRAGDCDGTRVRPFFSRLVSPSDQQSIEKDMGGKRGRSNPGNRPGPPPPPGGGPRPGTGQGDAFDADKVSLGGVVEG